MFNKDFKWGCATAAIQIEGAINEDKKAASIWDVRNGTSVIKNHDKLDIACDSYHRYLEDIALLKKLGANAYRFSVSWVRIMDDNNEPILEGINYYHKVIDACLANNITPFITLYHWDLPNRYRKIGGWASLQVVKDFVKFTEVVLKAYSSKVKHFITINEISSSVDGSGNTYTLMQKEVEEAYPSYKEYLLSTHHLMLAHALALKIIHKYHALGGYAASSTPCIPLTNSKEDVDAARKAYFDIVKDDPYLSMSMQEDPVYLGKYPDIYFKVFNDEDRSLVNLDDLKIIANEKVDFFCQNLYTSRFIKSDGKGGYIDIGYSKDIKSGYLGWNRIIPETLYWGPKFLYERYHLPIYITENGFSLNDQLTDDKCVHDVERCDFIKQYLSNLKRACEEGIPINGYFYWSLLDNFEWFQGYGPRFGIVYVDFKTLKRYPKDSFYTYQDIIKNNGNNL